MTELVSDGRWPADGGEGLALRELRGRGRMDGELRIGPLRLPIRFSFTIQSRENLLLLRPRHGARFLAALGPWLGWSTAPDGSFLLNPAELSRGRITLDSTAHRGGIE